MKNNDFDHLMNVAAKYVRDAEHNATMNPTSDFIQIVICEPSKKPYKRTIERTLDAMREIVGGYIEVITIGKTATGARLAIVLNEEGKLEGLPFNKRLITRKSGIADILVGTFFITAFNYQGDEVSLTDGQCATYIKRFAKTEIYI